MSNYYHELRVLLSATRLVLYNQGKIMSAQDDLNNAISDLASAISTEIAALAAAVLASSAPPGVPDAAVEASVAKLNDLTASLKASVTPAAPVEPAPTPAVIEPTVSADTSAAVSKD